MDNPVDVGALKVTVSFSNGDKAFLEIRGHVSYPVSEVGAGCVLEAKSVLREKLNQQTLEVRPGVFVPWHLIQEVRITKTTKWLWEWCGRAGLTPVPPDPDWNEST